jgi:hypothetical protein
MRLYWLIVAIPAMLLLLEMAATCLGCREPASMELQRVTVLRGPHAGVTGTLVSVPWIGNGYNLRMTLNIAGPDAGKEYGQTRTWVDVWSWDAERVPTRFSF